MQTLAETYSYSPQELLNKSIYSRSVLGGFEPILEIRSTSSQPQVHTALNLSFLLLLAVNSHKNYLANQAYVPGSYVHSTKLFLKTFTFRKKRHLSIVKRIFGLVTSNRIIRDTYVANWLYREFSWSVLRLWEFSACCHTCVLWFVRWKQV